MLSGLSPVAYRGGVLTAKDIGWYPIPWIQGQWYSSHNCCELSTSGTSLITDRLYLTPIFIPAPLRSIASIGIECTNIASGTEKIQLGIWTSNPTTVVPGQLLAQTNTIQFTSVGSDIKKESSSSWPIGTNGNILTYSGLYWLGFTTAGGGAGTTYRVLVTANTRIMNLGIADPPFGPTSHQITMLTIDLPPSGGTPAPFTSFDSSTTFSTSTGFPPRILVQSA